jgi:hypothetical protein
MAVIKYPLRINTHTYEVELQKLTTAQIYAIAAIPKSFRLVLEGRGNNPDRELREGEEIELSSTSPTSVYATPPTTFG